MLPIPSKYCWESSSRRQHAQVWSCGRNDHGQCGVGTMMDKPHSVPSYERIEAKPLANIPERMVQEWCNFSDVKGPVLGSSGGFLHSIVLSKEPIPTHIKEQNSSVR
jgi:hypothetical protein